MISLLALDPAPSQSSIARILAAVVVSLSIASVASGRGEIDLKTSRVLLDGPCSDAASADFNGDGFLDLAILRPGELRILSGDGRGNFADTFTGVPTNNPDHLFAADFNNDGTPDLVAGSTSAPGVAIWIVTPQGAVLPGVEYPSGGTATPAMAVADLDGDGFVDVVTVQTASNTVSVLPGLGGGILGSPTAFPTGAGPVDIVVVDADASGTLDVLTADSNAGTVSLLRGDGSGGFALPRSTNVGLNPIAIAAARFTSDSTSPPGLLVIDGIAESVRRFRNDGTGGFILPADDSVSGRPISLAVADVDHDSVDDVVGARQEPDGLFALFGNGSGAVARVASINGPRLPVRTKLADIDEDGHVDALAIGLAVEALSGNGQGGFGGSRRFDPGVRPHSLVIEDFDSDSLPDMAALDVVDSTLSVHPAIAPLQYGEPRSFDVGGVPYGLRGLDMTGDGVPELVFFDGATGDLVVWRRFEDGTWIERGRILIRQRGRLSSLASGDFDEDGAPDLACAIDSGSSLILVFGDGSGGLRSRIGLSTSGSPRTVATGDIDGDSHTDLVVGHWDANFFQVYLGNGDGTFAAGSFVSTGRRENVVYIGHADSDAHPDIAVRCRAAGGTPVLIFQNDGLGGFTERGFTTFTSASIYAFEDFDGDGLADLLGTSWVSPPSFSRVQVRRNGGDYTFDESRQFGSILQVGSGGLIATRGGADDTVDIFAYDANARQVEFLRNRSTEQLDCRRGNVNEKANAGLGPVTDVLFANGSAGEGRERTIRIDRSAPLEITVVPPPSRTGQSAPFALYAWKSLPEARTVEVFPNRAGSTCMATPVLGGSPGPLRIWNGIGFEPVLGVSDHPVQPAPTRVLARPQGVGRPLEVFFQGFIRDGDSPSGRLGVTNGLAVIVE